MTDSQQLLCSIAQQVLRHCIGHGRWVLYEQQEWTTPDDPMLGLNVGDDVFFFDEDECDIQHRTVSAVFEGIAYCTSFSRLTGPYCFAVTDDVFARTREEAAQKYKTDIDKEVNWYRERLQRAEECQALIGDE